MHLKISKQPSTGRIVLYVYHPIEWLLPGKTVSASFNELDDQLFIYPGGNIRISYANSRTKETISQISLGTDVPFYRDAESFRAKLVDGREGEGHLFLRFPAAKRTENIDALKAENKQLKDAAESYKITISQLKAEIVALELDNGSDYDSQEVIREHEATIAQLRKNVDQCNFASKSLVGKLEERCNRLEMCVRELLEIK